MNAKAFSFVLPAFMAIGPLAVADTLYVDVSSTNPVPPYTNWSTAANVIQDAVDAASDGDTVLVTNGVYDTGGRAIDGTMTNRVAVDKPLTLMSVNGPDVTLIKGYQVPVTGNGNGAIRCVFLANGAVLIGFTLTNGATRTSGDLGSEMSGGGLSCESIYAWASNCVMVGNSADAYGGGACGSTLHNCTLTSNSSDYSGGGACGSTLHNCTLTGNSAGAYGGGAYGSTLHNCTLTGNSAGDEGGGSYEGTLNNCTLTGNSAELTGGGSRDDTLNNCTLTGNSASIGGGGGATSGTLNNCIVYYNSAGAGNKNVLVVWAHNTCTTPRPPGTGNITNAPLFMDTNGWANLRLQSNSPCINAGNSTYVTTTNDLDGNPRIAGGTVDMGAYEFQDPSSMISYAWLQRYGLPTDGSADNIDEDGDMATTWQEWKMWTIPTNGLSVLKMATPDPTTNGTEVIWQSVANHTYELERAPHAGAAYEVLQSGIASQGDTTTFTDTTATNGGAFLYRVSVPE